MLRIGQNLWNWTKFLLYIHAVAQAANDTTPALNTASGRRNLALTSPLSSSSTCQSRTVNWITHTLPQQCLRTSWTAEGAAAERPSSSALIAVPVVSTVPVAHSPDTASNVQADAVTEKKKDDQAHAAINTQPPVVDKEASSVSSDSPSSAAATKSSDPPSSTTAAAIEAETDSPLDNANFLSFEEWKKQNLARAGQSPENVGQGRSPSSGSEARRRPVNINNALDSLGEDAEIELNFGGFGASQGGEESAPQRPPRDKDASSAQDGSGKSAESVPASPKSRSKDAGKTCKGRFNYASFDCAATVLKTNPQSKSSSSVLVENKDSYMLNECGAPNKFLIVELCDDILVDTIVLANFEFFSSMFRTFRVSVSDRYPVKLDRWKVLGTFEARNSRDIQAFAVEESLIWARYLRVEFLEHYGNEYYCPVSLLRVHGTTMMEEFRNQEEGARGEDDLDEEEAEEVRGDVTTAGTEPVVPPTTTEAVSQKDTPASAEKPSIEAASEQQTINTALPSTTSDMNVARQSTETTGSQKDVDTIQCTSPVPNDALTTPTVVLHPPLLGPSTHCAADIVITPAPGNGTTVTQNDSIAHGKETQSTMVNSASVSSASQPSVSQGPPTTNATTLPPTPSTPSTSPNSVSASSNSSLPSTSAPTKSTTTPSQEIIKPPSSTTTQHPPPPNPTTQESFFKSIHKRLQSLEANTTLSLQYIEAQSRILRDAFAAVERRQLARTAAALDGLNASVAAALLQHDRLWRSAALELEAHRQEVRALGGRLALVAEELVWQKRVVAVQAAGLMLCLGVMLFVRVGPGQVEIPLVQQVLRRSRTPLRGAFESPLGSPTKRPASAEGPGRKRWRWGRRRSGLSDGSPDGSPDGRAGSPGIRFSPPTPPNEVDGRSDVEGSPTPAGRRSAGGSPEAGNDGVVRETQSGPATPRGTRDEALRWAVNGGMPTDGAAGRARHRSPLKDELSADEDDGGFCDEDDGNEGGDMLG